MRVVVQQFNSSSTGLVQDGFGHTQNLNFDLCGQQTNNHNFWEWSASPSDDLHCGWISNLGTGGYSGTGNTQRYTVQRSGAGSGGTYPWTTYIDGDPVMSMSTNFATGAEGAASAEYNNCFSCNPLAVWHGFRACARMCCRYHTSMRRWSGHLGCNRSDLL